MKFNFHTTKYLFRLGNYKFVSKSTGTVAVRWPRRASLSIIKKNIDHYLTVSQLFLSVSRQFIICLSSVSHNVSRMLLIMFLNCFALKFFYIQSGPSRPP